MKRTQFLQLFKLQKKKKKNTHTHTHTQLEDNNKFLKTCYQTFL